MCHGFAPGVFFVSQFRWLFFKPCRWLPWSPGVFQLPRRFQFPTVSRAPLEPRHFRFVTVSPAFCQAPVAGSLGAPTFSICHGFAGSLSCPLSLAPLEPRRFPLVTVSRAPLEPRRFPFVTVSLALFRAPCRWLPWSPGVFHLSRFRGLPWCPGVLIFSRFRGLTFKPCSWLPWSFKGARAEAEQMDATLPLANCIFKRNCI